ncbi:chitinase 2-like [Phragmites australis]|uniref:chitinase 2-like n=1 Tax=Phragmites australis TaxID=29695 RepID=UPI002D76FD6D|nr:chitinase 2-like [Phragmites australis]
MASLITMASALQFLLLLLATLAGSASAAAMSWGSRPLFREYIGAEGLNVTFADVPVHPSVDFHFILSFAIDYTVDATNASAAPRPADGRFGVFWDEAHLTPAAVAAAKRRGCGGDNVRVALSLGGDSIRGANATFRASSVDAWVGNAIASLTDIITRYGLDGVDIDYEHFGERETPEVFAECIGRLVRRLKADGVICFASIAPFANPDVQAHYGELWHRYGCEFEYVNFQFYAYAANTTVAQFLDYYDEQSRRYAGGGGKVLVGFGTDPASGGLGPEKGFFRACRALRRQGRLHGIFVWAADNSAADGFRHELCAQRFLAGAAPGFP